MIRNTLSSDPQHAPSETFQPTAIPSNDMAIHQVDDFAALYQVVLKQLPSGREDDTTTAIQDLTLPQVKDWGGFTLWLCDQLRIPSVFASVTTLQGTVPAGFGPRTILRSL